MLGAQGDLFDLANALASLLEAPVTIESTDTLLLAHSGGDQDVDEARVRTILGRQVPAQFRKAIATSGVHEHLAVSDEVFLVNLPEVQMVPRAVVALRDSTGLLGSVWAAIPGGPSQRQREALLASVPAITTQVRREQDLSIRSERERQATLGALLAGGEQAESAAIALGGTGPWQVAVLRAPEGVAATRAAAALWLHLSAVAPDALSAAVGDTTYGVLPARSAERVLTDFLRRYSGRAELSGAVGTVVASAGQLAESRHVADEVAEALTRRGHTATVGTLEREFTAVLVDRVEPFLAMRHQASPLTRLREHDQTQGTVLAPTVAAFLDAGDVAAAAEALAVHPNTVRNRLRRAREQCAVDLREADVRLALMVHLRVVDRTSPSGRG